MRPFNLRVVLAVSSAAAASALHVPLEAREPAATTNKFCSAVNKIVTAAHQQAAATSFCQSYVGQVTVTTSTVSVTTTTETTLTTPTACVAPSAGGNTKRDNGAMVERDVGSVVERDSDFVVEKRNSGRKPSPKPSCLSGYNPGAALSSACNCLGVVKGTTTVTSTSISTSTAQATVVAGQAPAPNNFYIVASGGPANGLYAQTVASTDAGNLGVADTIVDFNSQTPATIFNADVFLTFPGNKIATVGGSDPDFVRNEAITGFPIVCDISMKNDGTCPISCAGRAGYNVGSVSGSDNEWYLGTTVVAGGSAIDTYAVDARG